MPATNIVFLDGRFVDRTQALVSVDDRGFLFGDGVYEVTRARGGRLFEGERHARRLERNLRELGLVLPAGMTTASLNEVGVRLLRDNGLTEGEALIYFQVTRGVAPRTHQYPPAGTAATVYVSAGAFVPPDAVRARGAACVTYPDIRWARCDMKVVNLLPNVMAKQEAVTKGAYEAIFVRDDGTVTEGASTNVFAVIDGELRTHPKSNRILPGITRDVLIEVAAAEGIAIREEAFDVAALRNASEAFLASTMNDVMPIVTLDGRPLGDGRPGPLSTRLFDAFAAHIASQCGPAAGRATVGV
ncbi:MAG TPA: D-amino acid aminotransferase [Gemmatimonadaceae bacterium]|nr:D-amino acid aminotransferase [Gemmatimonadaceae bacterium]